MDERGNETKVQAAYFLNKAEQKGRLAMRIETLGVRHAYYS